MSTCARVCIVSTYGQDFGAEVKRRRGHLGLSQRLAARRSGLSPSGWSKAEKALNVGVPERSTVIAIARVLGWDPDAALAVAGHEPATDMERVTKPTDPASELDRLWTALSEPQRWSLVYVASTMVSRHQWPELDLLARPHSVAADAQNEVTDIIPRAPSDVGIVLDASTGAAEREQQRLRQERAAQDGGESPRQS